MFTVEIIEKLGKPSIRIPASQVVIRMPDGTPVSVAAIYGGPDSVLVSHCSDKNFQQDLKKLGITETVVVTNLKV
jgi:hypothetical protein